MQEENVLDLKEDFELILFDRMMVIHDTIKKYGEENFYISFSGGKDSTILHYLIDMTLPNNKIPRVYANTGIEYTYIYNFVKKLASKDDRFEIIAPSQNIKKMLEEKGYPFKSKDHSNKLGRWKNGNRADYLLYYRYGEGKTKSKFKCPDILKYQFEEELPFKIDDSCCKEMKKKPFHKWQKENNKSIAITGMRREEGGQRVAMNCIVTKKDEVIKFHPLAVVSEEWEDWFVEKYQIELCELYYPPYNFKRTGCKGCPFAINLQHELDVMEKHLPNERKQCEAIWKPVYQEYRRIGYRLDSTEQLKLDLGE